MIVSFDASSKKCDTFRDICYKDTPGKRKTPLYSQTVKQLESINKPISGVIIPAVLDRADYNPRKMIEHIRLSSSDFVKKTKVVINDLKNIINDNRLEDHIGYGIDIKNDSNLNFADVDELTDNDLKKIVSLIGIKQDSITKHDQANIWGPYRLIKQFSMLYNQPNHNQLVDQYESDISESLFFKKILIQESKADEYQITEHDRTTFNTRLKKIRNSISKVAIIDDEIDRWGSAYKILFDKINTDFYDEKTDSFILEKTSEYDLIILDLRLEEKDKNNEIDQLNIESYSGMVLLDKIKKVDPTIPVIICTASNKAWSHDAAISKGADGFWTKESPTVSLGMDYSFHNTFDLISVCFSAIQWSNQVKPIFTMLDSIHNRINTIDTNIAYSLKLKYNLIASNLLRPPNPFIDKTFKNTLDFPFLVIWSIMNDIISLVKKERYEDDIEYIDCHFQNDIEPIFEKFEGKYIICEKLRGLEVGQHDGIGVNAGFSKPISFEESLPKKYINPDEKVIMKYLLFKTFEQNIENYNKKLQTWNGYRKIRNHIDFIHGKDEKNIKNEEIKIYDLDDLLNIYHEIVKNYEE